VIWQGYLSLFTKVTETQSTTATAAATAVAANVHVGNPHALSSPINLIKKTPQCTKKAHISITRKCSFINIAPVAGISTFKLTNQVYERYKCLPYSILDHCQFHFCYHMKLLHL
jgi:hypothetical protein